MSNVYAEITTSLDGFVAGPNPSLEHPLGEGGEKLHEWVYPLRAWREPHDLGGGETGPDNDMVAESLRNTGATVMGRRMFSGGEGPWESDPNADGWWGDDPPFRQPVFILTHHAREPVTKKGGTTFTFVTDGVESALEQARAAAGGKDVQIAGGANAIQQFLNAGLLDELRIHIAPILLGDGVVLFEQASPDVRLEIMSVTESLRVTHLKYRVLD